jgi:hypothetical protein
MKLTSLFTPITILSLVHTSDAFTRSTKSNIVPSFQQASPRYAVEVGRDNIEDYRPLLHSQQPTGIIGETPQYLPDTKKKSGRDALPAWGRKINESLRLTMITHADKKHVHAISGSTWFIGGYSLLLTAWAKELLFDDWSTFATLNPFVGAVCLGAAVSTLSSSPLRHDKRYPSYSKVMRNGMCTGICTALLCSTFAYGDAMPPMLHDGSLVVLSVATLAVAYQAVVDRAPWDFRGTIEDLKLEMPPEWAMVISKVIGLSWLFVLSQASSHALLGTFNDSTILHDETFRAFCAQMSLGLSMTPAGDALVGSLMQKDRFSPKAADSYKFVTQRNDGRFETNRLLEAAQMAFTYPGPIVASAFVALATDHADTVQHFFHLLV